MTDRITVHELQQLLENEATADETLRKYFEVDDSVPFSPHYKLKPGVQIDGPQEVFGIGGVIRNLANKVSRRKRNKKYAESVLRHPQRLRVVTEGDSWFQYPHRLEDIIDNLLNWYSVYSVGAAGDTLANMLRENEVGDAIESVNPGAVLLSGGGNDLFGELEHCLNDYTPGNDPGRLLNDRFAKNVDDVTRQYEAFLRQIRRRHPGVQILIHGYDAPVPSLKRGKWLWEKLEDRKVKDPKGKDLLAAHLVSVFYGRLEGLLGQMNDPMITLIDLRGSVGSHQWYDEIHPTDEGFQQCALRFQEKLHTIPNPP